MVAQLVTVILGGSDTTRSAMAIQVALLLQDREQWEAVCADKSVIPGAVAEALRFEPAVGSVPRFTVADIEIDGHTVPAGRISPCRRSPRCATPPFIPIPIASISGGQAIRAGIWRSAEAFIAAWARRWPGLQLSGAPLCGHRGTPAFAA